MLLPRAGASAAAAVARHACRGGALPANGASWRPRASLPSTSAPARRQRHSGSAPSLAAASASPSPSGSNDWASALAHSTTLVSPRSPTSLVLPELSSLRGSISSMLGSSHPALDRIAGYYFAAEGKHVRPLIVLLMAQAANGVSPAYARLAEEDQREQGASLDEPISPAGVLNDDNPRRAAFAAPQSENILCTQRRLADISEMIHVASLLHDDVLDEAALRRGAPSAPAAFGNKLAVLAGDFLLGRASVALARLGNLEVVELLATVLANLVEGEVLQLQAQQSSSDALAAAPAPAVDSATSAFWRRAPANPSDAPSEQLFEHYLHKTYLKTAALMAKSARASVILGGCGKEEGDREVERRKEELRDAAYTYGRNLGIAFQLVDDMLDFRSASAAFGKPSGGADLRLGIATAPVLFAWQEAPAEARMGEMVRRKFGGEGDVPKALALVEASQGLQRTAKLAQHHVDLALAALDMLPPSAAREALAQLAKGVLTRSK